MASKSSGNFSGPPNAFRENPTIAEDLTLCHDPGVIELLQESISKILEILDLILPVIAFYGGSAACVGVEFYQTSSRENPGTKLQVIEIALQSITAGAIFGVAYAQGMNYIMPLALFLWAVLSFIETLEALNGFGPPDTGGEFRENGTKLSAETLNILIAATPDECEYYGSASDNYSIRNEQHRKRLNTLAETDLKMAEIISVQASHVARTREMLAGVKVAVHAALITYVVRRQFLAVGPFLVVDAFVTVAALGTLCSSLASTVPIIACLISKAEGIRKKIQHAQHGYEHVAKDVKDALEIMTSNAAVTGPTMVTSGGLAHSFSSGSACILPAYDDPNRTAQQTAKIPPHLTPHMRFANPAGWATAPPAEFAPTATNRIGRAKQDRPAEDGAFSDRVAKGPTACDAPDPAVSIHTAAVPSNPSWDNLVRTARVDGGDGGAEAVT